MQEPEMNEELQQDSIEDGEIVEARNRRIF